jgi:hypothetical protein
LAGTAMLRALAGLARSTRIEAFKSSFFIRGLQFIYEARFDRRGAPKMRKELSLNRN